jgi:tripartite-type tricarboxylate transporter receptor subunit TctC
MISLNSFLRNVCSAAICAVAMGYSSGTLAVDTYPTRPISIVVGYTPGGSVDLAARIIAPELSKRLGQSVVVENAAGASGAIGAQKVVSANADGYTLLLGSSAEISVVNSLSSNARYNGLKDLTPLALIGTQPMVLVGSPKFPFKNTDELLAGLKANPGKYSYASSGNGSLPHLAGELFKQQSGTFPVHIPFRGAASMVTDILGGQVEMGVLLLSSAMPHLKTGKLTAFGLTQAERAVQVPAVPALGEHPKLKGMNISVFFGLFGATKLPSDVQARLSKEMVEVLNVPEVKSKLLEAGFSLKTTDTAGAKAFIAQQAATYRAVIEKSKITE